jgi:hypothetical protein
VPFGDAVRDTVMKMVGLAKRDNGAAQISSLFSDPARAEAQAKLLATLLVQFAARPHELVTEDRGGGGTGMLTINEAGNWQGMLKRRGKMRVIPYDAEAYGVPLEDARVLLDAIHEANTVGRRRALRKLSEILKPSGLTPRDLRAIGGRYAQQRLGLTDGSLAANEALANVLRHDVLPSSTALSAYQRVGEGVPDATEASADLYAKLITQFAKATPEVQKQVLALLSPPPAAEAV